jgi:hypothetical protein
MNNRTHMMEIIRVAIFGNYFQEGAVSRGERWPTSAAGSAEICSRDGGSLDFTHAAVDTCAFLTYTSPEEEIQAAW